MPAGIGRKYAADMFAAIGGLTKRGRAENALGMGGKFAAQRQKNLVKYGKSKVGMVGMGLGLGSMGTNRSTGSYRPVRPMTNTPKGTGRYA